MNGDIRFPTRFFLITFIFSWVIWAPLVLVSLKIISFPNNLFSSLAMPIAGIGAFGPLVGALMALRYDQGRGASAKYFRSFFDIRIGWKAYVFPLLFLGGITFIAWFTPELFGQERLPMLVPSIWVFILYLIIMIFLGGGQEEFGWRGYALALLESKFGIWFANIILGIIWACWHIPLWFISGLNQTYMSFVAFLFLTLGLSFIFSWIRNISGNKPFAGLYVHGVANAFIPFMPILIMQDGMPQYRFWIWGVLTFLVGILITIFRSKTTIGQITEV